jgi:uncharacterized protein YnzC (UPF0291/DUF896 family)
LFSTCLNEDEKTLRQKQFEQWKVQAEAALKQITQSPPTGQEVQPKNEQARPEGPSTSKA